MKSKKSEALRRPARPELLSPLPFYRLAPSRWLNLLQLLASLAALAVGGWLIRLFLRYPYVASGFQDLALLLLLVWAALKMLLLAGEQLYRWPAARRFNGNGQSLLLYPSPLQLASALLEPLFMTLASAALLYYSLTDPLENWLMPQLARAVGLIGSLLGALTVAEGLDNYRRQRQQRRQQRRARESAAHQLPERAIPRHCWSGDGASPSSRLLNLAVPLLFFGFFINWLALLDLSSLWFLLPPLALLVALMNPRRRWRYRADDDVFLRERWSWAGGKLAWREEEAQEAAQFIGIYWSGRLYQGQLGLAGRAGGVDVLWPLVAGPGSGEGSDVARRLAEALSAASGLPLLYRWPEPPREIFKE